MAWNYSSKVKEHFFNPKNVGKIEDADAVGEVGNIQCGDALVLYLKVNKADERIEDVKFQTFGCGSAIASSSALTEMIKGKTLDEALKISNQEIAAFLDGLPPEKMHCSVMGKEALEAAVNNYRGIVIKHTEEDEGKIVCHCFGISDKKIERVVRENNLTTLEQVTHYTKAGGGCETCHAEIEEIIARVRGEEVQISQPPQKPKRLTNIQKINLIQETIEKEIRPALHRDGGDVELIDVDGSDVYLGYRGHCVGCKASGFTTNWIESKLRELVHEEIKVIEEPLED